MKRLTSSILFAILAQLTVVACDNSNGGAGGAAGAGGNDGGSGTSSNNSSSSSSSSSSGEMLGMGDCHTNTDCVDPNAAICLSPDADQLCGICYNPPSPCTADSECAMVDPTTICNKPACSCGESECMPGCVADGDCKAWEHCSPGHRCLPNACASNADCPVNFECASMACARKSCTTDIDCNGHCVNSQCYEMAGHCNLPPP